MENERENTTKAGLAKSKPLPPSWKIHLMLAWENWLKMLVTGAILIGGTVAALWYIPEDGLGLLAVAVVSLIPIGLVVNDMRRKKTPSTKRAILLSILGVGLLLATLYPSLKSLLFEEQIGHFQFSSVDDSASAPVVIPAQDKGDQWYLMEVHGKLQDTKESYEVSYALRLENEEFGQTLKGELKRSWSRFRVGRRSRGKRLVNHERDVHHLTADLGAPTTLSLRKLSGKLDGPLEVFLRPEPVMWSYLLQIDLPLLLLAGLLENPDTEEKRNLRLVKRSSFMLLFGAVFADNWMPGNWFGQVLLALIVALAGSVLLGYILPKLMQPLASRMSFLNAR